MWPPFTSVILRGWLCVLVAVVSTVSGSILYKKVDDDVVLKPDAGSVIDSTTSIMWKHGSDIAIEWDGNDIDSYRHFQTRTKLNISSGEMTITGLTLKDNGVYTLEINGRTYSPITLKVISAVSTPTVSEACDEEKTSCTLTCDGNITGAEPVTYNWKLDNTPSVSSKTHTVSKENHSSIIEFSCELENPVSKASSQPIPNPFVIVSGPDKTEGGGLKINTGLTVFICLLTVVVLLVLTHRWKAGMWFFQKASMPWEADFWRKDRQPRAAAESNGTPARQDKAKAEDEETRMALTPSKL